VVSRSRELGLVQATGEDPRGRRGGEKQDSAQWSVEGTLVRGPDGAKVKEVPSLKHLAQRPNSWRGGSP
jgi:hypothetical protein